MGKIMSILFAVLLTGCTTFVEPSSQKEEEVVDEPFVIKNLHIYTPPPCRHGCTKGKMLSKKVTTHKKHLKQGVRRRAIVHHQHLPYTRTSNGNCRRGNVEIIRGGSYSSSSGSFRCR